MTGKGGSPMLCTLSSFCSAEFPCREEEAEEGEEEACQEEEEEGEKEGGLSHAERERDYNALASQQV